MTVRPRPSTPTRRACGAVLIALVAALAACGSSSPAATTRNPTSAGGHGDAVTERVPKALTGLEADAEDVGDVVPHGRWDRVRADARKLAATWRSYRAHAVADGATAAVVGQLDAAIARLGGAAQAHTAPEALQAANDVSASVVELFALYRTAEPLDVARLDVVGRQIVLDVDRRDDAGTRAEVRRVQAIWTGGLRASVLGHDGRRVAAHMDATVDALRHAVGVPDAGALRAETAVMLEIVDDMEALY